MRRPKRGKHAFFIQRKSHVDDSRYFDDEGRRVYFDKACWAQWIMPNIGTDQDPKIVNAPVTNNDVSFQALLDQVWLVALPVTSDRYLAAIEQTMRDAKAGKTITDRQARRFLEWNKQRHERRGR